MRTLNQITSLIANADRWELTFFACAALFVGGSVVLFVLGLVVRRENERDAEDES